MLLLQCMAKQDPCKVPVVRINILTNYIHNTNLLNIKSAMNGYDPRFCLPGSRRATASRQQIFVPTETLRSGQTVLNKFVASFTEEIICDRHFTAQIIRSYDEYVMQNIPFSFNYVDDEDINYSSSMMNAQEQVRRCDEHQRRLMCFFENGGRIVQVKMQCETSEIALSTNTPPVFTDAFKEGLRSLQIAAKEPNRESSKRTFMEFVNDFGTHFKKVTQFGSLLMFEKLILNDEAPDTDLEEEYISCVVDAAYASIDHTPLKSLSPKIFENLAKQCDSQDLKSGLFNELNLNSVKVTAIGPTPMYIENLDENSTLPANPMHFQLMSIRHLFSRWWFKNIPSSPASMKPLNGSAIDSLFQLYLPFYEVSLASKRCSTHETCSTRPGKNSVTPASSACPPEEQIGSARDIAADTCNYGKLTSEPYCDKYNTQLW